MKAAVINDFGEAPQYKDFAEPIPENGDELIDVKAIVLENLDKLMVKGTHYGSRKMFPQFPAIPGMDGVGQTVDGKLVAFGNIKPPYGAFAEKAIAGYTLPIPEGVDPAMATAILPSVLTSLIPLKYAAELQPGETVLVNGATGVTGRIAVQVAKMLNAGKVVGTGRNGQSLDLLPQLGADEVIQLKQPEQALSRAFKEAGGKQGYDVIIDFLWGRPAEILIRTLIPDEVGFAKKRIRYLPIGEKAGSDMRMPASAFRTSGLEMMGAGQIAPGAFMREVEKVWEGIKSNRFYMEIERVPLADIAKAWHRDNLSGRRLVIIP